MAKYSTEFLLGNRHWTLDASPWMLRMASFIYALCEARSHEGEFPFMVAARSHVGLLENWMYLGVCAAGARSNKLEYVELWLQRILRLAPHQGGAVSV